MIYELLHNNFNLIKYISENTGILIRLDDISENMNWDLMQKIEFLFEKHNIKPVLGVIPNNQDSDLLCYPKNDDFWEKVRNWKQKGWEISMHGSRLWGCFRFGFFENTLPTCFFFPALDFLSINFISPDSQI